MRAKGKPMADIRTDVPFHLRQVYEILNEHGYTGTLRQRYGADFRRHIKFDDTKRSFYLSVRIPGFEPWEKNANFVQRAISEAEDSVDNKRKFGLKGLPGLAAPITSKAKIAGESDSSSSDSGI